MQVARKPQHPPDWRQPATWIEQAKGTCRMTQQSGRDRAGKERNRPKVDIGWAARRRVSWLRPQVHTQRPKLNRFAAFAFRQAVCEGHCMRCLSGQLVL